MLAKATVIRCYYYKYKGVTVSYAVTPLLIPFYGKSLLIAQTFMFDEPTNKIESAALFDHFAIFGFF